MTLELRLYGFTQVWGLVFDILETLFVSGLEERMVWELAGGSLAEVSSI